MNPLLLMALTFLAVALAVMGAYSILSDLLLRDRSRFSRRVDDEFRKRLRNRAQKSALFKNLSPPGLEGLAEEGDDARPGLRRRFEAMVEQSGVNITPGRLLAVMGAAAGVLGALALLVQGAAALAGQGVAVGAAAALAGAALPALYVNFKRKRRLDKLLAQLPDTFDLMARIVRAGQTVPQAVQAVADEFDAPVPAEFSYCYEQQNLGLPPEVAFRDLARRTGLLEVKIFVLAMLVQQQSGGNLAELLDRLAAVVRDRFRVRGKVKSLTAEGRIQAAVLLALPPALLGLMLLLNRSYGQVLLDHPNLLVATFVSELLGALWIRKIINFDF